MAKVAIIGAGIAGLSSAWALTKDGHQVTLYEQGPIPNPLSASGDEHRIIRRAYGKQSGYQKRIDDAYAAWEELFADLGERHLKETGFLLISQCEGDEADEYYQGLVEGGYPNHKMTPKEAAEKYPFLDASTFMYAAESPEGGALLCQNIAADLKQWLLRNGAELRENHKVKSVAPKFGIVDGDHYDQIIITAGAWVLELMPSLAEHLTTYRTAVGYYTPPQDLAEAWAKAPVILDVGADTDGYVIPPIAGSGVKLGTGLHKYASLPDHNRVAQAQEAEEIKNHFSPPFNRLNEYIHEKTVTCAYTFTKDSHFFVHQVKRVTVVSACSGHGYKFGAAIGKQIAKSVTNKDYESLKLWLEARD
ncbi:FAD-binding oxidoreductase [Ahrensia sp. 13_GOM-1096m]|uniref:NAD(P)/FAD-dependent oxidoreductase n=1 Tax=Ahrensia sp. 13_GOM-1096m TaxID=1380380 RepID=UPI000551063A|nr:FAD-dependent oxidoreductase [Ahrensia sp. 13_GOM-1096m]